MASVLVLASLAISAANSGFIFNRQNQCAIFGFDGLVVSFEKFFHFKLAFPGRES